MLNQKPRIFLFAHSYLALIGTALLSLGIALGSCAQGTDTIPEDEDEGSQSSSSSTGGMAGMGGAGGTNQGGMGGAGGANQGGMGGTGGGQGGNVGMPSAVVASIEKNALYVNCMPPGPASVSGSFDAQYDNSLGSNAALPKVSSAKLAITYLGNTYTWTFAVMPQSSIVGAGSVSTVTHNAGAGSGMGNGQLCDYCSGVVTLTVDWDLGGKTGSDSLGPQPVQCVF